MYAPKLPSDCGDGLPVTVRLPWRASLGNRITDEGKRHVECAKPDDVCTNAQPIRRQVRVADPCLQVGCACRERCPRRDRPRCRDEQEIAAAYLDLRSEEV